ncbi:hypothetical protein P5772_22095 [Bacillus cereus]|uniref:hypothetical protein n=1 Tax=Bacillus TaxID=1386 RepID=UPI0014204075|nr:hypothetical protein [Bacillus cereus]MDF9495167.1 hypothetical protein [Bacillus cereus]NIE93058.1 hypothetical protein [Bacillus sp. Ab-1751]
MSSSALTTAYTDLKAIEKLFLSVKNNEDFHCSHIYSIFRDTCLIVHEVINAFFKEEIEVDKRIKEIRNHVHLFIKKRGYNKKVFEKVLHYHISAYGKDTNNIGFYVNNGEVIGSTLYIAYLLLETDTLPFPNLQNNTLIQQQSFSLGEYVGQLTAFLSNKINFILDEKIIIKEKCIDGILDTNIYTCKDLSHTSLFSEDIQKNIFLLRLIFSLHELNDIIWIHEKYIKKIQKPSFLDLYLQIRLTTLKTDEVIDNLLNLKAHSLGHFAEWNKFTNGEISLFLDNFQQQLFNECSMMRNMIHYDLETPYAEMNFLGYLNSKQVENTDYISSTMDKIIYSYLYPLKKLINTYLNIESIEPIPEWEIINKRLLDLSNEILDIDFKCN